MVRRLVPPYRLDRREEVSAIGQLWMAILAAACLGSGLVSLALATARIGGVASQLTHGVMGLAMAAMLSPWGDPVPAWAGAVAFAVSGAWFASIALGAGPSRAEARHLVIASAAMVVMYLTSAYSADASGVPAGGGHAAHGLPGSGGVLRRVGRAVRGAVPGARGLLRVARVDLHGAHPGTGRRSGADGRGPHPHRDPGGTGRARGDERGDGRDVPGRGVGGVSTAPRACADTRPPHRLARALVLTCVAVAVGAAAHLLGRGAVDPIALAAAFPLLLGLLWPLTDRERGWLPIAGAQLAGQQVVHTLLSRAGDAVDPGLPVDVFLYGHVLAAVLVAVWLRRGEQRTWAAARRAARLVAAWWARLVVLLGHGELPYPVTAPNAASPVPLPGRPLLRHAVVRRGPPVHV